MYIYIYIYMYTYICIYIYTYIYTSIDIHTKHDSLQFSIRVTHRIPLPYVSQNATPLTYASYTESPSHMRHDGIPLPYA